MLPLPLNSWRSRLLPLAYALTFGVALVACGDSETSTATTGSPTSTGTTTGTMSTTTGMGNCMEGETKSVECGVNGNGTQTQLCTGGIFADQGTCDDPDVCTNADTQDIACGLNGSGTQAQLCTDGQWMNDGACSDPDVCTNADTQDVTCGLNGSGTQAQLCTAGQWVDDGACVDPDVCTNDDTQDVACGFNGNGTLSQLCAAGQWTDVGSCVDPDVCANAAVQVGSCGGLGCGEVDQLCVTGQWVDQAQCALAVGVCSEIEPNEDGTPQTGGSSTNGNDFDYDAVNMVSIAVDNATLNGVFGSLDGDAVVTAALSPAGDEDVFALTNAGADPVEVALDTYSEALGLGTPCGTSIDTALRIRDNEAVSLALNDDRNGSADRCSTLSFVIQPGETVYAHVSEYGDDAEVAGYFLQIQWIAIVCGDGLVAPNEACDDGGIDVGDGCDDVCEVEAGYVCTGEPSVCAPDCGDGTLIAPEECDDGNNTNNDGCDANCFIEFCGDGVRQTSEECDDGNNMNGDGCDANCFVEGTTAEVEPNNTGAEANTNGLIITDSALIAGSITDVTDEKDYFRVDVVTPTVVRFETFTAVNDCASGTTTTLRLFQADGVTQIVSDTTAGIRSCSAIVFWLEAGTYFIQVEETGTNGSVPAYFLEASFMFDGGDETEAPGTSGTNDTFGTADTAILTLNEVYVFGDHTLPGTGITDRDYYAVTVPAGAGIRIETIEGDLDPNKTCESNHLDSEITLFAANGTTILVNDDDSGRGFCSQIDGTGVAPKNPGAFNNTGSDQVWFIEVRESDSAGAGNDVFVYRLQVTIR